MGGVKTDWLKQLAPPHAPAPIGWWPLAPGWWALGILVVVGLGVAVYWRTRPYARLRRAALRELKRLETQGDDGLLARGVESLLRRYAVARFGREPVAHLSGAPWIAFVAVHGGSDLAGESGASLLSMAFGGSAIADRERWLAGARGFMKGRA
jgi:hypothetical protein